MPQVFKDTIEFDRAVGADDSQVFVESDIIVPENEPDALNILAVNSDSHVNNLLIDDGKVQVDGELMLSVLYMAEKGDIKKIEKPIVFSHYLEIDGANSKCRAIAAVKVEHIDYKLINSRKINIKAVLKVFCRVLTTERKEVVLSTQDSDGFESLKKPIKLLYTVGQNGSEVFLKEQVRIPDGEPEIDYVIKTDILIKPEEVKITDNRVVVQGKAHATVLYKAKSEGEFGSVECDLSYANFIEVPGALNYMSVKTSENIIEKNINIMPDDKGEDRIVDIELVLNVKAIVTETEEREIPVDVYSTEKYVEPVVERFTGISELGDFKSQSVVKANVELPSLARKVIDIIASPVISDYMAEDDKILIEGIVDYSIIYISDEGYIKSYRDEYPFKTFLDAENTNGLLLVDINVSHVSYDIIAMKEMEIKFVVDARADVFNEKGYEVITDVKEIDNSRSEENRHSITVYMVQNDDNLWNIAKKYRVNREDILILNGVEEGNILPGTKLLIPNKA